MTTTLGTIPLRRLSLTDAMAALLRGEPVPWTAVAAGPDELLGYAETEDLVGLIREAITGQPPADWPPELVAGLVDRHRAAIGAELVRQREIGRVLDALATVGVRPLLMKGTALAYTVYPHPAMRPRSDTDLLIRRAEVPAVREALARLEYQPTTYCDGEHLFHQFELQRRDQFGIRHALDFHWKISTQTVFADCFDHDQLDAAAVPAGSLHPLARALGVADALLLASLHPAMHHRNEERLIWLYDVHLLAPRLSQQDWDRLVDQADTKQVAAVCLHELRLTTMRLGTAIPAGVIHCLESAAVRPEPSARYLDADRSWRHELAANVRALPRLRERLTLLREVAFPSAEYVFRSYGIESVPGRLLLLPACYVHRALRGAWRVLAGKK